MTDLPPYLYQAVAGCRRWGKANRRLASLQLCLSFAGWYTLDELMEHNRVGAKTPEAFT